MALPMMYRIARLGVVARCWLVALLLAVLALAVSSCGASGSVVASPTPSHTPTPSSSGHGALYAFITNLGPSGPTGTDVYALGLGDGKQIWHTQINGGGSGTALGGGNLYLGTVLNAGPTTPPTGTLQAFNATTGAPLWSVAPPAGETVPIAANRDAVFAFVISFSGSQSAPSISLTALRASDGTALWSTDLGQASGGIQSGLVLGDGALYLVTMTPPSSGTKGPGQAKLNAIDTTSGKMLWQVDLPGVLSGSPGPVLGGGVLYMAVQNFAQGGTLAILAIQASDGKTLWSKAPPTAASVGAITVAGGTLCYSYGLLNGPGGGLVALRANDGGLSWQAQIQGGGPVPFTADNSTVYALESTKSAAPTLATTLNAFDLSNGRALLTKDFPTLPVQANFQAGTPLQVANGVLVVEGSGVAQPVSTAAQQPQYSSVVLALNTRDGTVAWQHQFNGTAFPNFLIAS